MKEDRPYVGVLYMGLMLTEGGPKVIEYNVRFGDPECQVLMPRIKTDLVEICQACLNGSLDKIELEWDPATCLTVTMAAPGYPASYPKGSAISGCDAVEDDITIFHAGTAISDQGLVTNGGRVLNVTALGKDVDAVRDLVYRATETIDFDGKHFRKDIGKRKEARPTC